MNYLVKSFTLVCFLIVSQLTILVAQTDSLELALIIENNGLVKYLSSKIESALDSHVDTPIALTTVFEILKKEIPELIVAEYQKPALSFKKQLCQRRKSIVTRTVKNLCQKITQNLYHPPAPERLISFKELLDTINCDNCAEELSHSVGAEFDEKVFIGVSSSGGLWFANIADVIIYF